MPVLPLVFVGIGLIVLLVPKFSVLGARLGVLALLDSLQVVGSGVAGLSLGCLMVGHSRLSLVRLQAISWTLILVSALFDRALANTRANSVASGQILDPLSIGMSEQL